MSTVSEVKAKTLMSGSPRTRRPGTALTPSMRALAVSMIVRASLV